jgi:hypothetical protein
MGASTSSVTDTVVSSLQLTHEAIDPASVCTALRVYKTCDASRWIHDPVFST